MKNTGETILIDLGNTSCKMAFVRERQVEGVVNGEKKDTLLFLQEQLASVICKKIVFCSVKGQDAPIIAWLKTKTEQLIVVDGNTPTALGIDYRTPDRLGADRLAAGVGALKRFPGKDLLVVDFGTAITFDFISKEGWFLGGNISLGMQLRFNALHHFTGALPLVSLYGKEEKIPDWGVDTRGALTAGVVHGIVNEVNGYITQNQNRTIIFTGRDAFFFANKVKNPIFVDYNLVFTGLAEISDNHV